MEPTNALWHLENIDVSGVFCPKKIENGGLEQQTHRNFKRGEYIFLPDEDADKVYFVFEGRVKRGRQGDH